jgi:hypothetical protein
MTSPGIGIDNSDYETFQNVQYWSGPRNRFSQYSDCELANVWSCASNNGASCNITTDQIAGHPGLISFTLGTSGSGTTSANLAYSAGGQFYYGSGIIVYQMMFYIANLSTSGDSYIMNIGLCNNSIYSGPPGDGITISYNQSSSPNWIYSNAVSNTATTHNSGIAVTTGWHYLKCTINGTTSATFQIDNNAPYTLTSTLSNSQIVSGTMYVGQTAYTSVTQQFYLDYFDLRYYLTSQR